MRTVLTAETLQTGMVTIEGDEAHHARNVLRVQTGQELRLCDGMGSSAISVVSEVARHSLLCEVQEIERSQPPVADRLEVIVAPPKGSRFEDMLRSLCELGVGRITPLQCARSGKMPRMDRMQRVCREAIKQCGRSWLPQISEVREFSTLGTEESPLMLLDPLGEVPKPAPPPALSQSLRLVIGPEGGLSPEERDHLIQQGVQAVCIAPHILRIETAAIAAAAIWISAWESYAGD